MTIKRDITKQVLASLKALTRKQVLVGIPDTSAERLPDPDDPQPASNALIGRVTETGSPAKNIPARPHLVPGVESVEEEVSRRYRAGAKAILDGKADSLDPTHTAVGLIAVSAVQKKIVDGPFAPLADATLEARRARGRTGELPLIDTGQYRRAQNFVIREKGH